jgi:hypothetical protein
MPRYVILEHDHPHLAAKRAAQGGDSRRRRAG